MNSNTTEYLEYMSNSYGSLDNNSILESSEYREDTEESYSRIPEFKPNYFNYNSYE